MKKQDAGAIQLGPQTVEIIATTTPVSLDVVSWEEGGPIFGMFLRTNGTLGMQVMDPYELRCCRNDQHVILCVRRREVRL